MSELYEPAAARDKFRQQARAWALAMERDDEDAAAVNACVSQLDSLVQRWAQDADVQAILRPLLQDDDANVRCTAASYLIRHGGEQEARPVLEALAEDDEFGLAASMAETALMAWKKPL